MREDSSSRASRARGSPPPARLGRAVLGPALAAALLTVPSRAEELGRPIRFDLISIDQGLSQATVTSFLQDRVGFMWIGTQDGLNRFDGYDFVVLRQRPGDRSTLPNNWIMALVEDPSGDVWVGTRGGGLSRWHRSSDTFTTYRHDPADPGSLAGDQVRTLLLDRDGRLWIGTEQSGLDRFDPATRSFVHHRHDPADPTSLADDQVRALAEDRDGRLWVGTSGGLARFDPSAERFVDHRLGDEAVLALLADRDGGLWAGTTHSLDHLAADGEFTRHELATVASLSQRRIRVLFEDRDGRLWVGTDSGLLHVRPADRSFARYRHHPADPASLSNDRVSAIYQDRGGVLWIGTQGGGVNKWDPRAWAFANVAVSSPELAHEEVLAFAEDAEGGLWIGTSGRGLCHVDRATGDVTRYRRASDDPSSLADDRVTALDYDRHGTLWVGTLAGGLGRFDPTTGGFERLVHEAGRDGSLGADGVMTLFEDRGGALWIGTFGGGLNRLESLAGGGVFASYRHDPADASSLSDDRVTALAEDDAGFLWVGTLGGGLHRLAPAAGRFLRFAHDPGDPASLSNDTVVAVHVAPTGTVWIGTQVGLNRLEDLDERTGRATFDSFFEADGLPNDFIYGIESDAGGGLWVSTNRGLSRFDPRTGMFKNYDRSHGLSSDEFNMGAHYRSPSGELFFGGIDGFNAFYPDRIEVNDRPPPVVLTGFSKLNRPVDPGRPLFAVDEVRLDHRDVTVSFEFAALDYTAPEKNRYRYRLAGFHREWIELGHRRRVTFTNLDSGRYVLRVQGSNHDGVWNEEGASVVLAVAPPPWGSWWAWATYLLAASALVWGFLRFQHAKVERERAVNRRLREVDQLRRELLANLRAVVAERTAQVEERERLLAERERLIVELEAKNAELERFNYTVSHDLKSPLVTIKGFLGLLQQDVARGDAERARHDVRRIAEAADRMQRLLDELLELSRLGERLATAETVALDAVAREAVQGLGDLLAERRAIVELADGLPVVRGDRGRLREVFQSLIENAVTYMGEQTAPRVEIGRRRDGDDVVVYVRDNGMGIEARYHEKIFGIFERLSSSSASTGIGLTLVRRIVEMHGGRIWVESEGLGRGSTFCFTLGRALT